MTKRDLKKDIIILILRLMGEPKDSMSPKCLEVFEWWEEDALKYIKQECNREHF